MKFKKGFTLLELLVVISIIGFLSSVILASINSAREKGRIAAGEKFSSAFDHSNLAVLDWSFAETSGDVIDGAGKLNGSISGTGVTRNDGYRKSSKGLCFSGNGIVTAGSGNKINIENGDWAISFWMKTDLVENYRNPFDMNFENAYPGVDVGNAGPRLEQSGSNNFALLIGNGATHRDLFFTNGKIETGKWYHLLAIKQGNTARSFVDGKLISTLTIDNGVWPLSFNNIVLGSGYLSSQTDRYFRGCLDNFKIYTGIINL